MDSLTQAVLGGAVGSAAAGPRLGRRAALWGAVAGTLPDLDVLAYPFLDPVGELRFHRGLTHGLAFAFVVGPLLGYAVWRLARWRAARRIGRQPDDADVGTWRTWTAVFFWGLLTHPILDTFTVYGTQLFAPFSDHPFAVGSVFIIDPLYTLPLAGFLLAALLTRRPGRRRTWAAWGLAVSTVYLGWSVGAQSVAEREARRALALEGVRAERVLTVAAPLNTLLWRTVAEVETDSGRVYLTGLRSLLDDEPTVAWSATEAGLDALEPVEGSRPLATLRWFSRGWLLARPREDGAVAVSDLRFGRADGDLKPGEAPFIFTWRLTPGPGGVEMRQEDFAPRLSGDRIGALWDRILGRTAPADGR